MSEYSSDHRVGSLLGQAGFFLEPYVHSDPGSRQRHSWEMAHVTVVSKFY